MGHRLEKNFLLHDPEMHKNNGVTDTRGFALGVELGVSLEKNIPKRPRDGPFGIRVGPRMDTFFSKEIPDSTRRKS
jgi:hypothetical protein